MASMSLFQMGDFTLHCGVSSNFKIECDALTEAEWQTIAMLLAERLPEPFQAVRGVPRGGVVLADAMKKYVTPNSGRLLVVDDVWTTGGSMKAFIKTLGYDMAIDRAVVFARGPVPLSVTALFTMAQPWRT